MITEVLGSAVNAIANATVASRATFQYQTLYPSDYGTIGGADDTPAMQACLDAAAAMTGVIQIQFPPILNLNSSPRHDRSGNAVLALAGPAASSNLVMVFRAADGGTQFFTTVSGQSYSSSFGPPSLIGGPTVEQTGIGPSVQFSKAYIHWVGMFRWWLGANPTICGLDMQSVPGLSFEHLEIRGNGSTQTTGTYQYGIRFGEGDNSGLQDGALLTVSGCYVGVVHNAHLSVRTIFIDHCTGGLGITGNSQFSGNDGHSSQIGYLLTQEVANHICGFAPASGVISIPNGDNAQLNVHLWDIEDAPAGNPAWQQTTNHVLDANNMLSGAARYGYVKGNVGRSATTLTTSGALNFLLNDVNLPGPHPIQVAAFTTGAAGQFKTAGWGNTAGGYSPLYYYKDGDGLLHVGGSAKTTNGTATDGTTIAQLPTGYRPATNHVITAMRTDNFSATARIVIDISGNLVFTSTALAAGVGVDLPDTPIPLSL